MNVYVAGFCCVSLKPSEGEISIIVKSQENHISALRDCVRRGSLFKPWEFKFMSFVNATYKFEDTWQNSLISLNTNLIK